MPTSKEFSTLRIYGDRLGTIEDLPKFLKSLLYHSADKVLKEECKSQNINENK